MGADCGVLSIVLEMIQRPQVGLPGSAQLAVRMQMEKRLELVLSDDAINALHSATFRIEAFSAPLHVLVNGQTKPPYIRNETGTALRYQPVRRRPRGENANRVSCALLWQQGGIAAPACTEVMQRWRPVQAVPVSQLGNGIVELERFEARALRRGEMDQGGGHAIVCRVELRDQGRLRYPACSPVQVVNHTCRALQLGVRSSVTTALTHRRSLLRRGYNVTAPL